MWCNLSESTELHFCRFVKFYSGKRGDYGVVFSKKLNGMSITFLKENWQGSKEPKEENWIVLEDVTLFGAPPKFRAGSARFPTDAEMLVIISSKRVIAVRSQ